MLELTSQHGARPRKTGLDIIERKPRRLGDLVIRQSLQLAQNHHFTIVGRQRLDGSQDALAKLLLFKDRMGSLRKVRNLARRRLAVAAVPGLFKRLHLESAHSAPLPQPVAALVYG